MSETATQLSPDRHPSTLRLANAPVFNPVDSPICSRTPQMLDAGSAWIGHIPFAMYLVSVVKPRVLVELGTHYGTSYCAFCQAVKELRLSTRCFAIDTWTGDPTANFHSHDTLKRLREHHDPRYSLFSTLLPSTFDDALPLMEAGSIDVLHIDGAHTYEGVKHDYEGWRTKLSDRGVVLFHDTEVRDRESYGVWRFWDEIKQSYPYIEFRHSHGLGVLAVGESVPDGLQPLLSQTPAETKRTRQFFENLGQQVVELQAAHLQKNNLTELLQVKTEELEALRSQFQLRRYRLADKLFQGSKKVPLLYPALRFTGSSLTRLYRTLNPLPR